MLLIFFGFFIHCIFLLSVFDIYFKSPIIHGVPLLPNEVKLPVRRLVLILADGLRADSFYSWQLEEYRPMYLRSIIEERGVWGVSHTRVPTESRPGHVALIAGLYEDPSAIFKGWKENPVEFDSIFNRSFVTYSWGSPDILPIFSKGADGDKIHTYMYSSDVEDFSGRNASASSVSTWVFDRVAQFFEKAKSDNTLKQTLQNEGVVFFLHLLGPDLAGHANKPHSVEYKENILVLDKGVKKIEEIISEFFNHDNKTAFILTSDHGMTDWGSHGAGTPHETETPLVLWGAGIRGPEKTSTNTMDTPVNWNLHHLVRHDIKQADLVPLMATLLGISIPVNSVGVLQKGMLNISTLDFAIAFSQNAFQLAAQYGIKRDQVKARTLSWLYKPFSSLDNKEVFIVHNIRKLIHKGDYERANNESEKLIEMSLLGLDYYHNYYQGLLLGCITMSFLGWIVWLFCNILPQNQFHSNQSRHINTRNKQRWFKPIPDLLFLCLHSVAVFLIYVQSLPLQFYIYCCLPLLLWWIIGRNVNLIVSSIRVMKVSPLYLAAVSVVYLIGIELLVITFFHRWVLSVIICALCVWPLFKQSLPLTLRLSWLTSTLALSAFPFLPVVGSELKIHLVHICGWLWLSVGLAFTLISYHFSKSNKDIYWKVTLLQLIPLPVTIWTVVTNANNFDNMQGLHLVNQIFAWSLLFINLIVPFTASTSLLPRLFSIALAFAAPYLLLCAGHEAFFLLFLVMNLLLWLIIELYLENQETKMFTIHFQPTVEVKERSHVTMNDFRRASFFLVYVILSFFGTGNIASINSFDPAWVRCFLTVFSPFTMSVLILLKTIIPFFLASCIFRAITVVTKAPVQNIFLIVLMLSDVMGLHFLYAIKNKGSWLEIGTSISHYTIVQVTTLFLVMLHGIAILYTRCSVWRSHSCVYQSLESKPSHVHAFVKKKHFE